jgi:hypothetical protein
MPRLPLTSPTWHLSDARRPDAPVAWAPAWRLAAWLLGGWLALLVVLAPHAAQALAAPADASASASADGLGAWPAEARDAVSALAMDLAEHVPGAAPGVGAPLPLHPPVLPGPSWPDERDPAEDVPDLVAPPLADPIARQVALGHTPFRSTGPRRSERPPSA